MLDLLALSQSTTEWLIIQASDFVFKVIFIGSDSSLTGDSLFAISEIDSPSILPETT